MIQVRPNLPVLPKLLRTSVRRWTLQSSVIDMGQGRENQPSNHRDGRR